MLGRRAILLTKFRDQLPPGLPSSVLHCSFAPFRHLFPHCAAVVHHGGVGTVAQALASGIPELARPLCFDQFDNGDRIKRLGVGVSLRPAATASQMAKALSPLLTPGARAACSRWQSRVDGPASLASAASLVESLAKGLRNPLSLAVGEP